jgi:hypothetical protein
MKRVIPRVLLAMLVITVFLIAGCGRSTTSSNSPAPQTQSQTQAELQSQVQALLQKQRAGQTSARWPSEMPPDVPVFTYGTITASSNNVNGAGAIQAVFDNVDPGAFDKYRNDLKKAGWTINDSQRSANGFEIDAEKNSRSLTTIMVANMTVPGKGISGAVALWPVSQ